MASARVEVGKEFNMRLDLINVGKTPGVLVRVEGLAPADFRVTITQPKYNMQNGTIEFEKKTISPFTDEAITFTVQARALTAVKYRLIVLGGLPLRKVWKLVRSSSMFLFSERYWSAFSSS